MIKKVIIGIILVILILILGTWFGFSSLNKENLFNTPDNDSHTSTIDDENLNGETNNPEIIEIPDTVKEKIKVKAVYSTGWSVGTKKTRENFIKNIKEYGFNAIVIDIKDESGQLSYNSSVQTAIDIGASKNMIRNIAEVIQEFKLNEIYVIGRIVTFKDPLYAGKNTDIAYKYSDGTPWKDKSERNWPNPYNKKSWEYPIALAKEACELGFDEIQFDYIRFPSSEGKVKQISFGFDSDVKTKSDIINDFLKNVMEELKEYNVLVSADVFGITTKKDGDFENIGQDFSAIAKIVDIICPMVYPSHYGYNEYNIPKPDKDPYNIIYHSLKDALKRVENIPEEERAIIRPYLQDFTASWLLSGNYLVYGTKEVLDQIQATYDVGIEEFMLWDPNNKYCYEALSKANWIPLAERVIQDNVDNTQGGVSTDMSNNNL